MNTNRPLSDEMIALIERGVAAILRDLAAAEARCATLERESQFTATRNDELHGRNNTLAKRVTTLEAEMRQIIRLAEPKNQDSVIGAMAEILENAGRAVAA